MITCIMALNSRCDLSWLPFYVLPDFLLSQLSSIYPRKEVNGGRELSTMVVMMVFVMICRCPMCNWATDVPPPPKYLTDSGISYFQFWALLLTPNVSLAWVTIQYIVVIKTTIIKSTTYAVRLLAVSYSTAKISVIRTHILNPLWLSFSHL